MNKGGNLLNDIYNRNKIIIEGYKKGLPKSINFEKDILDASVTILRKKINQKRKIKNIDATFLDILDIRWKETLLKCCYDSGSIKLEIKNNSDNHFKEEILHNAIVKFKCYLDKGKRIENYGAFFSKILYNTRMDHFRSISKNNHVSSDSLIERNQLPQASFTERESPELIRLDYIGSMVEHKELKKGTVIFLLESFTGEFTQSPQVRYYQRENIRGKITKFRKSIANPNTVSTEKIILKDFEESEKLKAIGSDYKKAIVLKNKATAFAKSISDKKCNYTQVELQLLVYINYTLALNKFNKLLEIDSTLFKSRYNLGFCLRRLGFTQKALMELDIALQFLAKKTNQQNYNFKMAATYEALAEMNLIDLDLPEKALGFYQKAISFQPKDVNVQLGIMLTHFEMEQYGECKIAFQKILKDLETENIFSFIKNQIKNNYKKKILHLIYQKFGWFEKEIPATVFNT